jgi:hypothetical protein
MVQIRGYLFQNLLQLPLDWEKKKTFLKEELEADGGIISDRGDLSQYITRFYANFYAFKAHTLNILEAQKRC